jgi:hypothetical protein
LLGLSLLLITVGYGLAVPSLSALFSHVPMQQGVMQGIAGSADRFGQAIGPLAGMQLLGALGERGLMRWTGVWLFVTCTACVQFIQGSDGQALSHALGRATCARAQRLKLWLGGAGLFGAHAAGLGAHHQHHPQQHAEAASLLRADGGGRDGDGGGGGGRSATDGSDDGGSFPPMGAAHELHHPAHSSSGGGHHHGRGGRACGGEVTHSPSQLLAPSGGGADCHARHPNRDGLAAMARERSIPSRLSQAQLDEQLQLASADGRHASAAAPVESKRPPLSAPPSAHGGARNGDVGEPRGRGRRGAGRARARLTRASPGCVPPFGAASRARRRAGSRAVLV